MRRPQAIYSAEARRHSHRAPGVRAKGEIDQAGGHGRRRSGGRAAWDPRLLVAVWSWAYSEGISSAREIERQMDYRPELEWLCGMEVVNHHTLSDFRVGHAEALEQIFTQVLAVLSQAGLIDLQQMAADGTRLRSQGATSSERRRGTIEKHLEQARAVVSELAAQTGDEESNKRRQAARRRAHGTSAGAVAASGSGQARRRAGGGGAGERK